MRTKILFMKSVASVGYGEKPYSFGKQGKSFVYEYVFT